MRRTEARILVTGGTGNNGVAALESLARGGQPVGSLWRVSSMKIACRAAKVQGGPGAAWHVLAAGKRLRELPITPDKLLQEGVIPEAPRLGTQGLMTSAMGLGCVAMSEFYH